MNAPDNMARSEKISYDPASNTQAMSSDARVTCSENVAYSTVNPTKEDSVRITTTSHTAVYEEVTLT